MTVCDLHYKISNQGLKKILPFCGSFKLANYHLKNLSFSCHGWQNHGSLMGLSADILNKIRNDIYQLKRIKVKIPGNIEILIEKEFLG